MRINASNTKSSDTKSSLVAGEGYIKKEFQIVLMSRVFTSARVLSPDWENPIGVFEEIRLVRLERDSSSGTVMGGRHTAFFPPLCQVSGRLEPDPFR